MHKNNFWSNWICGYLLLVIKCVSKHVSFYFQCRKKHQTEFNCRSWWIKCLQFGYCVDNVIGLSFALPLHFLPKHIRERERICVCESLMDWMEVQGCGSPLMGLYLPARLCCSIRKTEKNKTTQRKDFIMRGWHNDLKLGL